MKKILTVIIAFVLGFCGVAAADNWNYSIREGGDPMTASRSFTAVVPSEEVIDQTGYGDTSAYLTITNNNRARVSFSLDDGRIEASGQALMMVVGDDDPVHYEINRQAGRANIVFIQADQNEMIRLIKRIADADEVMVRAVIRNHGSPFWSFDVNGLDLDRIAVE